MYGVIRLVGLYDLYATWLLQVLLVMLASLQAVNITYVYHEMANYCGMWWDYIFVVKFHGYINTKGPCRYSIAQLVAKDPVIHG